MTVLAYYRKSEFEFPAKEPPLWAEQIDRWYQLDAPAYGVAQAYYSLTRENEGVPDLMLLASAGASNETDFRFAQSGALSPSQFVHTLPNVRASSLCQLMHWKGPVLCIQQDPSTLVCALREAADAHKRVWIWSVEKDRCVHWFDVGFGDQKSNVDSLFEIAENGGASHSFSDNALLAWLAETSSTSFALPGGYAMSRLVPSE